jgi:hypothetical protein
VPRPQHFQIQKHSKKFRAERNDWAAPIASPDQPLAEGKRKGKQHGGKFLKETPKWNGVERTDLKVKGRKAGSCVTTSPNSLHYRSKRRNSGQRKSAAEVLRRPETFSEHVAMVEVWLR